MAELNIDRESHDGLTRCNTANRVGHKLTDNKVETRSLEADAWTQEKEHQMLQGTRWGRWCVGRAGRGKKGESGTSSGPKLSNSDKHCILPRMCLATRK